MPSNPTPPPVAPVSAETEMLKALLCLYLMVPEDVARDVGDKVTVAFNEARAQCGEAERERALFARTIALQAQETSEVRTKLAEAQGEVNTLKALCVKSIKNANDLLAMMKEVIERRD